MWHSHRDLNPELLSQSQMCCHYTMRAFGVVDRTRTCMSYKGLLAFQASAPPVERLRHFGVRPRTRTETPHTQLLEVFKASALPIRLKRTYLASRVRLELTHRFKRFDSFRNCSCTIEASRHYWRSL